MSGVLLSPHPAKEKPMPRHYRYCPTRKLKHFNEAWAEIAAQGQSLTFGSTFATYKCGCGWWHTYDRSKRRTKEEQREPRSVRRKRAARGEPPPFQMLLEQRRREKNRLALRKRKLRTELPLRVWEDDGGAIFWGHSQ